MHSKLIECRTADGIVCMMDITADALGKIHFEVQKQGIPCKLVLVYVAPCSSYKFACANLPKLLMLHAVGRGSCLNHLGLLSNMAMHASWAEQSSQLPKLPSQITVTLVSISDCDIKALNDLKIKTICPCAVSSGDHREGSQACCSTRARVTSPPNRPSPRLKLRVSGLAVSI